MCGDGLCVPTGNTYECDCSETDYFGDHCEMNQCENILCGPNGSKFVTYEFQGSNICECLCNEGFEGPLCDSQIPSKWGQQCSEDLICNQLGQKCDSSLKQCICDEENGFILNQFQAEVTKLYKLNSHAVGARYYLRCRFFF